MKYGVFITRAQPIHKGHLKVIRRALDENDAVLLIIGSANKCGTIRNPLDINIRIKMVRKALESVFSASDMERIKYLQMDDWSMEDAYEFAKEWGSFLYYNIVAAIHQKEFTLYYSDDPDIVNNWFEPYIQKRIRIRQLARADDGISSTEIRKAILQGDETYLEKALPRQSIAYIPFMHQCIEQATNEDFIMN